METTGLHHIERGMESRKLSSCELGVMFSSTHVTIKFMLAK